MDLHVPYEEIRNEKEAFKVTYEFLEQKSEGSIQRLFQSMRCDFMYENDQEQAFCIWPEFVNNEGEVILDKHAKIAKTGTAKMWVLNPESKEYHRKKVNVGVKGYFVTGSKKIAKATITELVGLK